jgi:hypothetical protein
MEENKQKFFFITQITPWRHNSSQLVQNGEDCEAKNSVQLSLRWELHG